MERIKQAVEKARGMRGGAAPAETHAPPARTQVVDGEDIEAVRYSRTRIVAHGEAHLANQRIIAHNKADPASLAFDLLRTQVLQKMEERNWITLAVTSPIRGAGKTTVATNLAISIAQQTRKTTLLVDFDLRQPRVAEYLGLNDGVSLNEVLEGTADLPQALVNPDMPRLVVLPTYRPVAKPSETLASSKVANLIAELRDFYASRIIIFDLPPLLQTDDALAVLPRMDSVLLVVGNGMCTKAEIQESMRHLPAESLLGVVMNRVEDNKLKDYG